jgi:hypothetical protein
MIQPGRLGVLTPSSDTVSTTVSGLLRAAGADAVRGWGQLYGWR